MSEFKGTPGPWRVVEHSWEEVSVYGVDLEPVCQLHISSLVDEDTEAAYADEMLSNARLLSAALDLLESLESLMALESRGRVMPVGPEWDKARAAIAKALGETA